MDPEPDSQPANPLEESLDRRLIARRRLLKMGLYVGPAILALSQVLGPGMAHAAPTLASQVNFKVQHQVDFKVV
jgi:hypothetical protein